MKISVTVFRRPNMFKVNSNMFNMIGVAELEKIMTIHDYKTSSKELTLFYPERFLNIIEQRMLIKLAEKAGYESLRITTHSAYIIQMISSDCIGIVEEGSLNIQEDSQLPLSIDQVGMPNDGGLNVL